MNEASDWRAEMSAAVGVWTDGCASEKMEIALLRESEVSLLLLA
jgi:hypothetical protein